MPSRFEQYKQSESQKRELQSDLAELKNLYNSYESFYNTYTFDEFLEYSTRNSSNPLDSSILTYLKEKENEDKVLKEFRKTTVPWLSETIGGGLSAARSISLPIMSKLPTSPVAKTLNVLAPNEQEIRRGTDRAFRNVGEAVGFGDIWDEKTDEKTGKKYYEIQQPETTAGQILKPVGEYVSALAVTRNPSSLFSKTASTVTKRKVGRPSKADVAKAARAESTEKLLGVGKTLARAEGAAQVAFADDPEFVYVASALSNYIGNDDNMLSDVLNYLDVDEQSPEAARRLSLLLDGLVFSGVVSTGIGAFKLTKEGILKILNSVKNSSQSQKESFKSLIQGGAKTKSARQKDVPEVPIIRDISNENILKFGTDSLVYRGLNSGYKGVQRFYQNFLTTSGMYSEDMFKMLKSADYNKIGWSKRASEIHAKLVTSIAKAAKTSKFSKDEIDERLFDYLKGKKTLNSLPKNPELRQFAKLAKDEITNLSQMLLKTKYIPSNIKKIAEENMGSYLRKTYQFYEDKNWRPSQEVIDDVTNTIAESIRKTKGTKNVTPAQLTQARQVVNDILNRDTKNYNNVISHLNGVFGTKKNEIVFQQRKNIAPAIQKLLGGEEVDASLAVFRTLDTLGTQLTNYKLYDDLYNRGIGKWFFKETGKFSKAPDDALKAGKISGEQFLQLDGLRTTPEIAEYFNTIASKKGPLDSLSKVYSYFLAAKGASQAAATVFNSLTHVRNTIGGSIILMRNGINPFSEETVKSAQILSNDLFTMDATKKNKALSDLYEEYQRLGLVNQNVRVGEFKNLINDFIRNENKNLYSYTSNVFKKAANKATSVYVAEDDLWRIVAYNKELNTLKKAYPDLARRNLQDLKQEAANIVRDTMPTYDLIAPGLQRLRQLPIGNFFSFTAEQFRNNYNTFMRAGQELRSGNKVIQDRGMNRLASQITTNYLGAKGIEDFSKLIFGISDEDERAVRNLNLAPWSKNSSLLFSRDKDGNIQYIDLTYTDPSAPVTDNFRNIINIITDPTENMKTVDRNIFVNMIEGLEFFLRPFVSEALLTEAIADVTIRGGRTKEGFRVRPINPFTKEPMIWLESPENQRQFGENFNTSIAHILETVLPREVTDIGSLVGGKKAQRIEEGQTTLQRELLGKLTGQRLITITPDKIERDFSFKLSDLNRATGLYQGNLNNTIRKNVKAETVLDAFDKENKKNYKSYVKTKLMLDAAKHFDVDNYTIQSLVNENLKGYTKDEKNTFLYSSNEYVPLKISDKKLQQAYEELNFDNIGYREFFDAYTIKYLEYAQLPLLEEEKVDREEFFTGGLVTQSQFDLARSLGEDVFSGKLQEKTTEFLTERERQRDISEEEIKKGLAEKDYRAAFEAYETLPIGQQIAGYIFPPTGVPISAAGTAVYTERANPRFKTINEYVRGIVKPSVVPLGLRLNPVTVDDPLSAGIAAAEATGVIPAIGGIGKAGAAGLKRFKSVKSKDNFEGEGGSGDFVKNVVEIDNANFKSRLEEEAIERAKTEKNAQALVNYLKSPKRKGLKKEEKEYINLDNLEITKDTTPEDVIKYIQANKPRLYRVERTENPSLSYKGDMHDIRNRFEEDSFSLNDYVDNYLKPKGIYENDNLELAYNVAKYIDDSDNTIEVHLVGNSVEGYKVHMFNNKRGNFDLLDEADVVIPQTGFIAYDEGVIQAERYLMSKGFINESLDNRVDKQTPLIEQVPDVTKPGVTLPTEFGPSKYESFTLPSGDNYREFQVLIENAPGKFTGRMSQKELYDAEVHLGGSDELLHYRTTDRLDTDGNKILFVEEIQSDVHQAGRRFGYDKDDAFSDIGVPPFPFQGLDWVNIAVKDVANLAAKEGYDKVAFAPAIEQARRYRKPQFINYETDLKITDVTKMSDKEILDTLSPTVAIYNDKERAKLYREDVKWIVEVIGHEGLSIPTKNNPLSKQLSKYAGGEDIIETLKLKTDNDLIDNLELYLGEEVRTNPNFIKNKKTQTFKTGKMTGESAKLVAIYSDAIPNSINKQLKVKPYLSKIYYDQYDYYPYESSQKQIIDTYTSGEDFVSVLDDVVTFDVTPEMKQAKLLFKKGGIVRQSYFEGEKVSEDFPVTDVTEEPANRVDPFTGEPYKAQMEELGL